MWRCINRITMESFYFALFLMEISCSDTPVRCCLATDMARPGRAAFREGSVCLEVLQLLSYGGAVLGCSARLWLQGAACKQQRSPNTTGEPTGSCWHPAAPRTSPLLLTSGPGSAGRSIWREAEEKGAQTQHGAGCGSQGLSASLSQSCAQAASGQSSGIGPTGSRCSGWGLLVPSRQEEGLPSPGEWEFCKRRGNYLSSAKGD